MAKVKLQWKPPKELANDPMYQYDGALDVLAKVYRQDGLLGWYRVGNLWVESVKGERATRSSLFSWEPPLTKGVAYTWSDAFCSASNQGMDKQITKGVLSQAILFTTKDQYTFAVIALLHFWQNMQARAPKLPLKQA